MTTLGSKLLALALLLASVGFLLAASVARGAESPQTTDEPWQEWNGITSIPFVELLTDYNKYVGERVRVTGALAIEFESDRICLLTEFTGVSSPTDSCVMLVFEPKGMYEFIVSGADKSVSDRLYSVLEERQSTLATWHGEFVQVTGTVLKGGLVGRTLALRAESFSRIDPIERVEIPALEELVQLSGSRE